MGNKRSGACSWDRTLLGVFRPSERDHESPIRGRGENLYEEDHTFGNRCRGAFLGTASFFTQTHGGAALLAFAVFLIWRQSREKQPWSHLIRKESLLFSQVHPADLQ